MTDHIERFTKTGIALKSSETLEADIIVPATGLEMQLAGGAQICRDGEVLDPAELYTYRGMMLGDVPNFALAFGYTNAFWTLKVDLTCERVCRMLNHLKKTGTDVCVPEVPADIRPEPLLDFSSGYVRRALAKLPKQGDRAPWKIYQNYVQDMLTIRFDKLEDGYMRFTRAPTRRTAADEADEAPRAAAE